MTLNWLTYFPSPARGVWHLGPVPIRAYALCIIIGIVIALLIGDRRWRARGGEPGVIYDIALWAVPFGLIGGRLYHLMTDWRTYFGEGGVGWEATPRIWDGGLGIWGAVALGGVGAWIGCRRRGISLPAFGDAVAPGIVLAQAIGRIGNYFNQELYGRETTLPWGLEIFWREDAAGVRDPHLLDGVSTGELYKIVQPTFLYELLWNLLVFVVLIYADRRFRMGHGRLFALYIAGYCIGRFGIELLRDDAATHIAGIRVNSFTSTFVFIGAVVYILLATKGREDPVAIHRAWQPNESGEPEADSEQELEPEPEPQEEQEEQEEQEDNDSVEAGVTNGVGSVVRVPKRITGEAESGDADSDETDSDEEAVTGEAKETAESEIGEDSEAGLADLADAEIDENSDELDEAAEDTAEDHEPASESDEQVDTDADEDAAEEPAQVDAPDEDAEAEPDVDDSVEPQDHGSDGEDSDDAEVSGDDAEAAEDADEPDDAEVSGDDAEAAEDADEPDDAEAPESEDPDDADLR